MNAYYFYFSLPYFSAVTPVMAGLQKRKPLVTASARCSSCYPNEQYQSSEWNDLVILCLPTESKAISTIGIQGYQT